MNAIELLDAWQQNNGGPDVCHWEIKSDEEGIGQYFVALDHQSVGYCVGHDRDVVKAAEMAIDGFNKVKGAKT